MIHRYPYTDFNEYNLDWVIERVKQLTADWLETAEEWNDTKEDWDTLYNYVHDYFDNLDVSQEVGQIIDDYRRDGTLATICQPIVDHWVEDNVPSQIDSWLNSHVTQETGYVLDSSLTLANAAAPAKTVGDALTDVNNALDEIEETIFTAFDTLDRYLFATDKYINNTGSLTTLSGYNVYKIPLNANDVLHLSWDSEFYTGLTTSVIFVKELKDGSYVYYTSNSSDGIYYELANYKEAIQFGEITGLSSVVAVYVNAKADLVEDNVKVAINRPYTQTKLDKETTVILSESTAIKSQFYYSPINTLFAVFTSPYYAYWIKLNKGDSISFGKTITGVTGYGVVIHSDGTMETVNVPLYTATEECIIDIYDSSAIEGDIQYIPASVKMESQFDGLDGVAFGTSLTSRSISSFGYLSVLSGLSGIDFDNQGIGSSYIYGDGGELDMLAKIKSYTGYENKRVCVLEGFVNDWYGNRPIGTYTDTAENSVCGCVRSALNYIMSQNADITLFLILDHYGRNNSGIDCSTTSENGSGLTQYEYYNEIAKVAESLGIPVIKEFEVSQISENTPQYLADNIHLNALGAIQSAYSIWSQMKEYYPNQI